MPNTENNAVPMGDAWIGQEESVSFSRWRDHLTDIVAVGRRRHLLTMVHRAGVLALAGDREAAVGAARGVARRIKRSMSALPPWYLPSALAKAELLSIAGDGPAAERALQGLFRSHWRTMCDRQELVAQAFGVTMLAGDFATAAAICNRICDTGDWFEVGLDSEMSHRHEIIRWDIESKSRSRLLFSRDFCRPWHVLPAITEAIRTRFIGVLPMLAAYRDYHGFRPGTVCVNLGDIGIVPGLAFCESTPDYFLVPDPTFISTFGYRDGRQAHPYKTVPWSDRRPVALWRGATTGAPSGRPGDWRSLPRIALCEIGLRHPDLVDAGITQIVQFDDALAAVDIQDAGLTKAFIPTTKFPNFKYQIDIDGNTNSWPGLFQKLQTGSPILKVASPSGYRQWYYDRLKPWVNFVPVEADMSDLIENILWLRDHDEAAQEIGRAGHALAMSMEYDVELALTGRTIADAIEFHAGVCATTP